MAPKKFLVFSFLSWKWALTLVNGIFFDIVMGFSEISTTIGLTVSPFDLWVCLRVDMASLSDLGSSSDKWCSLRSLFWHLVLPVWLEVLAVSFSLLLPGPLGGECPLFPVECILVLALVASWWLVSLWCLLILLSVPGSFQGSTSRKSKLKFWEKYTGTFKFFKMGGPVLCTGLRQCGCDYSFNFPHAPRTNMWQPRPSEH